MSFIKVYIHFVWNTKNRYPYFSTPGIRKKIWNHIRQNAKEKGIFIDRINGYKEHCHCLVSLGKDQTLQQIMQLLKGESSHWINKENILGNEKIKFKWQEEYFAVSVAESILERVRNYIENQETHHSKKTFQEEYDEFISKYGFEKFKD
jgi:REP element-mobilizing transposase RayT